MPLARARARSASSSGSVSLGGVAKVGEQREVQVLVAVGEEAHLERLDAGRSMLAALVEHRRHHDQRARLPAGCRSEKSMRGSGCGVHQQRGQPVHQRDRELARGDQRSERRAATSSQPRRAVGARADQQPAREHAR